ncbi:sigma factor [Paraburkholderia sp. C35]|uniref:sigma factor n=1 Tax=Paraburkholderia sp. C35 TaxID=2126993 RepID=UPI001EF5253C|nr:sigma factor [Paraburkholderia sp. C35]
MDLPLVLPDMLPQLWSFALRLTESEYEAEELVHRACVRALDDTPALPRDASHLDQMYSIIYSLWRRQQPAHARQRNAAKQLPQYSHQWR